MDRFEDAEEECTRSAGEVSTVKTTLVTLATMEKEDSY